MERRSWRNVCLREATLTWHMLFLLCALRSGPPSAFLQVARQTLSRKVDLLSISFGRWSLFRGLRSLFDHSCIALHCQTARVPCRKAATFLVSIDLAGKYDYGFDTAHGLKGFILVLIFGGGGLDGSVTARHK